MFRVGLSRAWSLAAAVCVGVVEPSLAIIQAAPIERTEPAWRPARSGAGRQQTTSTGHVVRRSANQSVPANAFHQSRMRLVPSTASIPLTPVDQREVGQWKPNQANGAQMAAPFREFQDFQASTPTAPVISPRQLRRPAISTASTPVAGQRDVPAEPHTGGGVERLPPLHIIAPPVPAPSVRLPQRPIPIYPETGLN